MQFLKRNRARKAVGDVFVSLTESEEARGALIEEIEAFRKHLLRSVIWLAIGIGISFTFNQQMIEFLAIPGGGLDTLKAIDVTESVSVFMRVSLIAGAAIALIPIFFEFWLFFAPGLRPDRKNFQPGGMPFAALLFVGGMAFAYYVILPSGLPILTQFHWHQIGTAPRFLFQFCNRPDVLAGRGI